MENRQRRTLRSLWKPFERIGNLGQLVRIFNLINEVYSNVSFFAVHIFNIVDLLYIFSYFLYNRCKCGNSSIELLENAKECQ